MNASVLGFGCANLMGRINRRQSLRAMARAFEQGVNYFDTARSYGWGKSESVVGQFTRGRRAQVILTTKLGILPPPRNLLLEFARPIARSALSLASRYRLGGVKTFVGSQVVRHASSKVVAGQFDVRMAALSLDCSLKALRTDYIDILLLHSCTFDTVSGGDIFDFLDRSLAAGKIRHYGLATDLENSERICGQFSRPMVVQLVNNLIENNLGHFSQRDRVAALTVTPLGGGKLVAAIFNHLRANPDDARLLCEKVDYDLTTASGIERLLLSFALAANRDGVVVCGMHSDRNICANAAIAKQTAALDDEFLALATAFGERILAAQCAADSAPD